VEFIRIKCTGCLNSFRQPDFHTYHKTLPLPPKTTVAGLIGSALGISPRQVNDEWLKGNRFKMGIIGENNGKTNDLWQIRKYEAKQIAAYNKGTESTPYKTAVIIRELLYSSTYVMYLCFENKNDQIEIFEKLTNPKWALSLGREDELIRITEIKNIELSEQENLHYKNTVLPFDININGYDISLDGQSKGNILEAGPQIVKLPITFAYKSDNEIREANDFQLFSFVGNLSVKPIYTRGFYDEGVSCAFQIF